MKYFQYFWMCDHCQKPTSSFNPIEILTYNFGINGHMYESIEEAEYVLNLFIKFCKEKGKFIATGEEKDGIIPGYRKPLTEEEIKNILDNIKLFEVDLKEIHDNSL